jgi:hypothetical protein
MIQDHGGLEEHEMLQQSRMRARDLKKGNLRHEEGMNGEGIWVLPCTREDVALWLDDGSTGETAYGWLCNHPICPDVVFGSKVAFLTNGSLRPYSKEIASSEQEYEDAKDQIARTRII